MKNAILKVLVLFAVVLAAHAENGKGSEFYQRFMTKRATAPAAGGAATSKGKQSYVFQTPNGFAHGYGYGGYGYGGYGYGPFGLTRGHGYSNFGRIHPVPVTGVKALSVAYDQVSGVPYVCDPNKKADAAGAAGAAKPGAATGAVTATGKRSDIKEDDFKENDVKENDIKESDVKENDVKEDDVKDDNVKENDVKENDVKVDDVKEDDVKEDDVKDDNVKENDVKENDVKEDDVKEDDVKEEDTKKEDIKDDIRDDDTKEKDAKKDEIKVKIPDYPPCPDPKKSFPWSCLLGDKSSKREECARAKEAVQEASKRYWPAMAGFFPPFYGYPGYGVPIGFMGPFGYGGRYFG